MVRKWGITGFWLTLTAVAPLAVAQSSQDITTEFMFEIAAQIEDAISTGETKDGTRQAIPITGGTFEGPDIRGEVIPGGTNRQQARPDGVVQLEVIYMIRTVPEFAAPVGKYDWLNKHIFLSSVRADPAKPGYEVGEVGVRAKWQFCHFALTPI